MTWQPIETAPKDGRDVLLGYHHHHRWIVVAAHYRRLGDGYDNRPVDRGIWYTVKGNGSTVHTSHQEIWWQPLPAPPK